MFRSKILKKILNNQKGNSLMFVLGLGAVATLIALAVLRTGQGISTKDNSALRFYSTVELVKANFYNMISNDLAWQNTIAANASMAGMTTTSSTGASFAVNTTSATYLTETPVAPETFFRGTVIKIYDANNTLYYDPTSATQGFKYDGTVCNTYLTTKVDRGCIMRVRVAFRPLCSAACTVGPFSVVLVLNFFGPDPKSATSPGVLFDARLVNGIVPDYKEDR